MAQKRCIHCDMMMNESDLICPHCKKSQFADSYVPEKEELIVRLLKSRMFRVLLIVIVLVLLAIWANA